MFEVCMLEVVRTLGRWLPSKQSAPFPPTKSHSGVVSNQIRGVPFASRTYSAFLVEAAAALGFSCFLRWTSM